MRKKRHDCCVPFLFHFPLHKTKTKTTIKPPRIGDLRSRRIEKSFHRSGFVVTNRITFLTKRENWNKNSSSIESCHRSHCEHFILSLIKYSEETNFERLQKGIVSQFLFLNFYYKFRHKLDQG